MTSEGAERPALIVVAHGTSDADGVATWEQIADAVRGRVEVPVGLAYADVRAPTIAEALSRIAAPAVVVPAFLASGYHVRTDIPAQVVATGRADVSVAPALGPDAALVAVAAERLRQAGRRTGDAVVLGAAGSTDRQAQAETDVAAAALSQVLGVAVAPAAISGEPPVAEVVARLRHDGAARVAAACWLLAPGFFARSLVSGSGADLVAAPLGAHPEVAASIVRRYDATVRLANAGDTPDGSTR
ncbi:MAG: sirohydrochlorin chelatase [Mycobacteriales bacterium]